MSCCRKYGGLRHLDSEYAWLNATSVTHSLDCRVFSPPVAASAQSRFRFGAILVRR